MEVGQKNEKQAAGKAPETSPLEDFLGFPVHGFASLRYRARFTDGDSDQDLYETLSLNLGAPDRHRITAHFLGRLTEDIDGHRDQGRFFVFDSITDTYKSNVNGRIYYAYVDVHRLPVLEKIRLGRQTIYETPALAYFDGGQVETQDLWDFKLKLGGYAGVPVHLFESSPEGDVLAGAYVQGRPWKGGRARFDYMHASDETTLGVSRDDLFGAAIWQSLGDHVHLHALYTFLEDRSRDLLLRGTYQQPEWDFRIQGSYYELITAQRDLALEFDPFFSAAFEHSPYRQTRWLASKGLGEHFAVEGGIDLRRLKDLNDEGAFNRDFERYFLTPSVHDFPAKGLSASITGEIWDSRGRDIRSAGADVSYQFNSKLKTSIGTYYSLYKYDFFADRERDHVQTYYFKVVYKWIRDLRTDLEYEFEDDEFDEYHVLRVGLTWSI